MTRGAKRVADRGRATIRLTPGHVAAQKKCVETARKNPLQIFRHFHWRAARHIYG
jgi:hypothetical protein